jgi:hypothetical protein
MLTLTVRALERDGLVARTVHASVPPRVDYELTELGQTLLIPLGALADRANTHRGDIQAVRERHDRQAREGHLGRVTLRCCQGWVRRPSRVNWRVRRQPSSPAGRSRTR